MKNRLNAIIWFLVGVLFQFAPVIALGFPFWIDLLLIIAMTLIPYVNIIAKVSVWIWALIVTINGPQDWFSILYYIFFGINLIYVVSTLFSIFFSRNKE